MYHSKHVAKLLMFGTNISILLLCTVKAWLSNIFHPELLGSPPRGSQKKCLSCQIKLWSSTQQHFHADACMISHMSVRQQTKEIQFSNK